MPGRELRAGWSGCMVVWVALAALLILAAPSAAAVPRLKGQSGGAQVSEAAASEAQHRLLRQDEAVHFQVIGDWGRQGRWNQSETANSMAAAAQRAPPQFVVSVGDNFYPSGLISVGDANFADSFQNVYHHAELQVPWYAVLGNHDYGDGIAPGDPQPRCREGDPPWKCSAGPLTQLAAELRQRDSRWHCRRSHTLSLAGGALDIFMYDTTPFVQYYYDRDWADNPGGIREQSWMAALAELETALAESTAGWKLVVGHHPVRSNGVEHGDTPELRRWVEPLLHRYGVQAYLAGHDHDLEHIHAPGQATHHIVSGAGSQVRPEFAGARDSRFQAGAQGFVAITVRRDVLDVSFYGLDSAQPSYTAAIKREARVPADSSSVSAVPAEQLARQEADSAARMWGDEAAQDPQEEQYAGDMEAEASLKGELPVSAASAAAHFLA